MADCALPITLNLGLSKWALMCIHVVSWTSLTTQNQPKGNFQDKCAAIITAGRVKLDGHTEVVHYVVITPKLRQNQRQPVDVLLSPVRDCFWHVQPQQNNQLDLRQLLHDGWIAADSSWTSCQRIAFKSLMHLR